MSHAVVRGSPTRSQLYFDGILDSAIQDGGARASTRDGVNLAEVLSYCLRTNPEGIHTIIAETGEKFTNQQILKRAVSIARALTATCAKERVIIMLRNHEHMSPVFYAVLFSGVVPFMMEPGSTEYEIQQFLPLISPRLVFCEPDRYDDVLNAVRGSDVRADVIVADGTSLDKFVKGCSDDIDSLQLPDVRADSPAIILPTSGSTGLPKAALLSHQGLLMQIPSAWTYHIQFPQPTRLVFLTSTVQWMTHTILTTTCPVYRVPILMTSVKLTAENFVEVAGKYRPTWALIGPAFAAAVGHLATKEQLSSFDRLHIGGSPFSPETLAPLMDKLPEPSRLLNVFGMTEVHGFAAMGPCGTPITSVGTVINLLDYRIINENGQEVSQSYEKGELHLKGKCVFKGYLNNQAAYKESLAPDGWLKTGDIFYKNEDGNMFFANRTKLSFKYLNHHIYPEEIERVIESVPGVQQSVVFGAEAGPAAAAVLQPGCEVSRESIHQAVNSTLSDYKRLRGGVAFMSALPRTHSGKLNRARCLQLMQELIGKGECF